MATQVTQIDQAFKLQNNMINIRVLWGKYSFKKFLMFYRLY